MNSQQKTVFFVLIVLGFIALGTILTILLVHRGSRRNSPTPSLPTPSSGIVTPATSPSPSPSPSPAATRSPRQVSFDLKATLTYCFSTSCSTTVEASAIVDGKNAITVYGGATPSAAVGSSTSNSPLAKIIPDPSVYGPPYPGGMPVVNGYLAIVSTSCSWTNSAGETSSTVLVVPSYGTSSLDEEVAAYVLNGVGQWLDSFSASGNSIPVALAFVSYGDVYGIWNTQTWQKFMAVPDLKIDPKYAQLPPETPVAVVLPIANASVSGLLGTDKWQVGTWKGAIPSASYTTSITATYPA